MSNYFKLNLKVGTKEYLFLFVLLGFSISTTYLSVYLIEKYFKTFSYNIFNVIGLEKWIGIFLMGIFLISLIRPIFFALLIKMRIIENYFSIFLHTFKYGLFAMPFFISSIMLGLNNSILEQFGFSFSNSLNVLLFFASLSFLVIWIVFLGTTIKSSLMQKYSFFKASVKNSLVSVITGTILSGVSFPYILDINKYEYSLYNSILDLEVKKEKITIEKKEELLTMVKEKVNQSN